MTKHWLRILVLTILFLLLLRLFGQAESAPFGPTREGYQREGMVQFILDLNKRHDAYGVFTIWVPTEWAKDAVLVAACESQWNTNAVGDYGRSRGLFQINFVHLLFIEKMGYTWDDMFDPRANISVAVALWQREGRTWRLWSCKP